MRRLGIGEDDEVEPFVRVYLAKLGVEEKRENRHSEGKTKREKERDDKCVQ